jgi:hypothetical protein
MAKKKTIRLIHVNVEVLVNSSVTDEQIINTLNAKSKDKKITVLGCYKPEPATTEQ